MKRFLGGLNLKEPSKQNLTLLIFAINTSLPKKFFYQTLEQMSIKKDAFWSVIVMLSIS